MKAFSRIFAESLWLELRDHGVDVLHLVLGVTRTPAMERFGLDFDAGFRVSDPEDVAREGLEQLPHGPVRLADGHSAERQNHPDRAATVLGAHEATQRLLGLR